MFEQNSWYDKLPNKDLDFFEPNFKLFFKTMFERQNIWTKRFLLKEPSPWTDDQILNSSKFTNVYRELDRNSQWQIENILLDDSLTLKNLIWKLMVFRYFNNPSTFYFIQNQYNHKAGIPDWDKYNEDEFASCIEEIRGCGQNPFTNAYLINSMAAPGCSRDYCYTRVVIPQLHKNINKIIAKAVSAKTPEDIINYLKTLPAISDFIAHEFYQDFTYIQRYTDRKFMKFDQNDFTNVGPGASLGIRLIFPNLKTIKEQKQVIYKLRDYAKAELDELGFFPYLYWDKTKGRYYTSHQCNITLHQIEMWLCEFQKYWKMTIGEGKQRSKFIPKSKNVITK